MTNAAAIGYMILAAKTLDLPKETIINLERAMYYEMDFTDEEAAEKAYRGN